MAEQYHDIEIENSLLGSLILNPKEAYKIKNLDNCFYDYNNQVIFSVIKSLYENGRGFDSKIIFSEVKKSTELTYQDILELIDKASPKSSIDYYVSILHDTYNKRQFKYFLEEAKKKLQEKEENTSDIINNLHSQIINLTRSLNDKKESQEAISLLIETFEEIQEFNFGDKDPVIPTTFKDLDNVIGGIPFGEPTLVGARTGVGKTTFAVELALKAVKQGFHTLFVQLELKNTHLGRKIISRLTASPNDKEGIDIKKTFRKNALTLEEIDQISQTLGKLDYDNFPLWVKDDPSTSTNDIRADIEHIIRSSGKLDFLIVDSASLMRSQKRNHSSMSRVEELDLIIKELREIAKNYNIALLLVAQINRQTEQRANKRPTLADIRESGAFEQESSIVLGLYRDELYDDESEYQGLMEIIPLKQRFGASDQSVLLRFDPEYGRFLDSSLTTSL